MPTKSTISSARLARVALLSVIFSVLIVLTIFIVSGPSRRIPSGTVTVLPQVADAGLQEFAFLQSKDGRVDWKIQARQAQVFDAEAKAVLSDVNVTLTGVEGVSMTVTGDEGTINTSSRDFVIGKRTGDLALVLKNGYTIYTSRLAWANQEHRLWTDEPVRITGPRMEVTGQGMDAFLETREMRIRRNVRVGIH
jgi:lipopolysaccharide export system protein LptC